MASKKFAFALVLLCSGLGIQAQVVDQMKPQVFDFEHFSAPKRVITPEMEKLIDPAFRNHPEYGQLPYNAPCEDCFELLQKRTPSSRYYVNNNSNGTQFTLQNSFGVLHYPDLMGQLISIDPEVHPIPNAPGQYGALQQPVPARLNLIENYASLLVGSTELKLNHNTKLFHLSENGSSEWNASSTPQTSVGKNGAKTLNLWPGIDREVIFEESKIKTNYILNQQPLLSSGNGWLSFEDTWELPVGYSIVRGHHGTETKEGWWRGDLSIQDVNGTELFHVYVPKMWDENPNHDLKFAGMDSAEPIIAYEVKETAPGHFVFRTLVSVVWLMRPERVYPVTIDPLVTGTSTYTVGDMGFTYDVPGCLSTLSAYCGYPMSVNVPGASVLTACTFSAAYSSLVGGCGGADCLRANAAFRILGPCGFSPAGGFWTCAVLPSSAGNCTGTNLVATGLVTCLPPSCPAWVLNFEMRLNSCNCVTGACDMACHVMYNNSWIMNVSGQTFNFTNPVSPITASTTTVCLGNSVNLSTNGTQGVPPYTFNWSLNPGFVPILTTGTSVNVTPSVAGPTTYYLQVLDACGQANTSSIVINAVTPPTVAAAGGDQTVCSSTATLAGNTLTSGTGLWTVISGGSTVTTPSNPTSGVTNLGPGANVFQWTTSATPCPSTNDQVTITRVLPPTVSAAGPDQNLCASSTSFAGNTATSGTGLWSYVSGPGGSSITTPGSPTSGLTGLSQGTYDFAWTISNAPCPSTADTVQINVAFAPTVAAAGPDQIICSGTTPNFAGNVAVIGTGLWTYVSGPAGSTINNPSSETSSISGLVPGTYIFEWTISNLPCAPTSDQVSITVVAPPNTANAGPDQEICAASVSLAANIAVIGTGNWTFVSGPAGSTIVSPSVPSSQVTGLVPGVYVFQWTISNAPCASSSSTVTITVSEPPTVADAGPDQTFCGIFDVVMAGNSATIGSGIWTQVSGTGGTITTPADPVTTVTGMGSGVSTFTWTITNGSCPPSTDNVVISTYNEPVADFVADSTVGCEDFPVSFTNNSTGTSSSTWDFGDGTVITDPGTNSINHLFTDAGFFDVMLIVNDGPCLDTLTLNNYIVVGSAPVVNFVTDPSIPGTTEEGTSLAFTNLTTGGTTYLWEFGDGDTATTFNTTHIYDGIGEYCVTLTAWDSLGCTSAVTQCTLYVESGGFTIGNVFTPNDDGINDAFGPITTNAFRSFSLKIYDRWGALLWEGLSTTDKWNGTVNGGKEAPEGVYYFTVFAFRPDGELVEVNGTVTLLR